jgi:simple sugar transport system permease protein
VQHPGDKEAGMSDLARPNEGLSRLAATMRAPAIGGIGGLVLLLAVLAGYFSLRFPAEFPTLGTLQSMMFQLPELGILALAMVIPLISGGLNLAIIATANQSALLMIVVMQWLIPADAGTAMMVAGIAAALVAGLAHCLLVGLVTGFIVARIGIHPILVTLGTMSVIQGVSIYLTRGRTISGVPEPFLALGNGFVFGIPAPFVIFVIIAIGVSLILTRTAFGISVYSIGSNIEATRYSGIDTGRTLIGVYTLSSVLCFFAACIMLARFNSASPSYAESYLLITILAAVLGGVDPFGGFGRILGLVVALAVLQVIASGLNLEARTMTGSPQHFTLALWGLTLILVMAAKTLWPKITRRN